MEWAFFFLSLAFLALIGATVAYLIREGFQAHMTMEEANARMGPNSDAICQAQSGCNSCLDDKNHPGVHCGWCPAAKACIPRSGTYRILPQWVLDIISLDPTKDCSAADFVSSQGKCPDVTCSDYKNCRDCAGALACGWCTANNKCFSKLEVAMQGSGGSNGSNGSAGSLAPALCASASLVVQSGTCPPPVCSAIMDCTTCTNTTGCGYCRDSMNCISIDGNGSSLGGSSGSTGCAQGSIMTQSFKCPCSTISKCTDCAERPGCGYCKNSSTCVNLDRNDMPSSSDCASNAVATSASQCVPGAKLGNVRSESGGYKPSDDELGMTQNNTPLGGNELNVSGSYGGPTGAGAGPVSPPRTSPYVSGNGVIRRYGDSSIRGGISRSEDLAASPVEDYVKLLVRSELASEGIPMNEPFQVNEKEAPGNATDYLKKSFNKVFA